MNTMNDLAPLPIDPPRTWRPVYTVVERGQDKRYFLRLGTAFTNRDQSVNLKLDAIPVNGQLVIRDAEPYDPSRARRAAESSAPSHAGELS